MSLNHAGIIDNSSAKDEKNNYQPTNLVNLIPAIIAYVDKDYRYRYVNGAYVNWIGISADSLIGKRVDEVLGKDTFLNAKPHIDLALSGVSSKFESSMQNKDGLRHLEVSLTPDFNENNEVAGYAVYIDDLTDKRKTEADLRDYVETASIGLHWVNAAGIITWANQAELDLLGYTEEEYIGQHISQFYVDKNVIENLLERLGNDEKIDQYEVLMRCKDGSFRQVSINSSVLWENGQFIHTRCFTIDITARKEAEQALRESEGRYRNLLKLLPAAVYTCNAEGYIQLFNDAAVDLWGRKPEIGKDKWCGSWKIFDPVNGLPIQLDTCPMAKTLKYGKAVTGSEIVIERPDGVRRNVVPYPQPIFDIAGNTTGAINMLVDVTEEKLAAKAIREKDERFTMIAHLVPIIIWMSDEEGNFVYLNKEWNNMTGRSVADGLANHWLSLVHPDDRQHARDIFMQAKSGGRIYADKFRYQDAGGNYISLQSNGIPRFNDAGVFIGYIGVFQNINQQELIKVSLESLVQQRTADLLLEKEALKISEQRYQRMVTEVQDYAIILLDTEGNIKNWNKGAQSIKGYSASEAIGKSFRIFYTKNDQKENLPERLLKKAVDEGRAQHEGWRVRKDGSLFWGSIVITSLHDDDNQLIGFSKVTRDLSERKMAEDHLKLFAEELKQKNEQLKLSEQRYYRMISEVEDYAILQLNEQGDIINWNIGAQLIKGYSAEEIIGKNFRLFYSREDLENGLPVSLLEQAREKGKAAHEGWRIRKDGTRFWASMVLTALHNDENEIIGFSKVTRDLTERKFAEEALKEKNKELEKRNEELSEFAYISSHDLQEPLRKIQTFSTRILELEGNSFSEKGRDFFNRIQSAAFRMRTLIDDLLTYSRTNTAEQKFVVTDLNKLLQNVINELGETIEDKKVTIEYTPLPTLSIIPFQFHQLIVNILTNAIKFAKKEVPPHISIQTTTVKDSELPGSPANRQKSYYHISFKDNGIGFEPQFNTKVFEVFQRLHGRTEYEGTGIGLAICKKIVENHDGIITSEGCIDEGATFHIYLPIS